MIRAVVREQEQSDCPIVALVKDFLFLPPHHRADIERYERQKL